MDERRGESCGGKLAKVVVKYIKIRIAF